MSLMKRWFLLGSVLSALAATDSCAATVSISEFSNLGLGNRWVYQQSAEPGLWTLEVDSIASRNGLEVILLQEYDEYGNKNDQHFYQNDLSAQLRLVGGLNDFGEPTEKTFFYDPPLPQLINTFTLGQVYSGTTTMAGFPEMELAYEYVFDFEAITVPAGFFANALRVTEILSNPALGVHQQSLWFVCGTGLVKRIQDETQSDENIWELSGFSGTTKECTETSVPEPGTLLLFLIAFGAIQCSASVRRQRDQ